MNRRKFWSVITGGLLGARLGWYKVREFTNIRPLWLSIDTAEPRADVVGLTSDIDLSVIDFEPLIESFKKLDLECVKTGMGFQQIRKDICASPVFLDLEEDDD